MCGIAGIISTRKADGGLAAVIRAMTDSMVHRGPDDAGCVVLPFRNEETGGFVALGHRRLKIIDLSEKAHQPMSDSAGSLVIVYNGEVYNYVELREELKLKGHHFASTSDTEVVLAAYAEWGTDCFARFNGMWALAIFDKARRKVVLSRDRFGKKPLYYCATSDEFIFASEIKAILKHPSAVREPNIDKIFRYLSTNYRYVDVDSESFFKNIRQVPKSHFLEIGDDLRVHEGAYWRLAVPDSGKTVEDADAIAEFRNLLTDAIRLRLSSDVPVGCMLSGGMDSTSITCVAYKILKKPIVVFSGITGNVKGVYDESEYIDAVVEETNADCHYVRPDPADIFDTVDEMLAFHDEPVCTVTWYSLYLIAKKIRHENVPVILNGHGGDELLAGYWDHYHYHFHDLEKAGETRAAAEEMAAWSRNHGRNPDEIPRTRQYIEKLAAGQVGEMSRFPDYGDCFVPEVRQRLKRDVFLTGPMPSELTRRLYSELLFETIPPSLRPEDRNTMSQSLESRSPFLDYRLAEFCMSLSGKQKIRNGLGKWLLREAMKGVLPEKVRTRRDKAGFIAPADEWFRTVNREQIAGLIGSREFSGRGLFNVSRVAQVFDEHLKGQKNHYMFLWQLINLELWFRRFFDRP